MSKFTTPLDLRAHHVRKWEVLTEFEYYRENDNNDIIKVPAGYTTDLATIPRCFWAILPPHDKYAKAAVIHDYLYSNAIGTKEEADLIFKEAMEVLGVPKWKITIMYFCVKHFGKGKYHQTNDTYLQSKKKAWVNPLTILRYFRKKFYSNTK